MELLRISFFSGIVCCGLATLKNASFRLLPSYFVSGFVCGALFTFFNDYLKLEFFGGFVATIAVCAMVKSILKCKKQDYLFIVLPTIYCITPGGALYSLFLNLYKLDIAAAKLDFIYSIKIIFACLIAIIVFEKFYNKFFIKNS